MVTSIFGDPDTVKEVNRSLVKDCIYLIHVKCLVCLL